MSRRERRLQREREKKKEISIPVRFLMLFLGLCIMSFGIAFSVKSNLGTSPISSIPYAFSLITPMSMGVATIVINGVIILLQVVILRKEFHPFQLMQIPVVVVFGYLIDFASWTIESIEYSSYFGQWVICIVGIIFVGIGVACEVVSQVTTLPGEGLAIAICKKFKFKFSAMKICVDVSLVVIACVLGLVFLQKIEGVREGTLAAAIFVGIVAKFVVKILKKNE